MKPGVKKALKISGIVLGVILILFIILNFIAGPIAKSYINSHCKELFGRTVKIEKISTNLFVGKIDVVGFTMLEDNDQDEFVTFDTLIVRINPFKLMGNELKLSELTLVNPKATIIQDGDKFNFDSLIDFFTSDEEEEEGEGEESNWVINLNNITLKNGNIIYIDKALGSEFDMGNLQLAIPHIYFSGENTDVGVNLDFAEGGKLGLAVEYGMEDGTYNLNVDLKDFSLAPILPYLKEYYNISSFDGKLNTNIIINGSTEHIMNLKTKGVLDISNTIIRGLSTNDVITADKIRIDVENMDLGKDIYVFNEIDVTGLKADYVIYDTIHTNFDYWFVEDSETTEADDDNGADTESNEMQLTIKKMKISDSEILYVDKSLIENFTLPIKNVAVEVDNFDFVSKFSAKINAMVGDKGELRAEYNGALDDYSNLRLKIWLKNIKLKDLSPYCVHYTAYPIKDGIMSLTSISNVSNNYLSSSNELNILNMSVDKKLKGVKAEYSNIPLKAGLYMLSDRNKKISIDLPITGNLDDPTFRLGKIIWRTFCNFIIKVAASPFDAIRKGSGENNFRDMYMDFSDRDLTVENYQQLNGLASDFKEIISAKPEIKMTVTQSLNKDASVSQIALFMLKMDYYMSTYSIEREELGIEDFKMIKAIKDKDPKLVEYARTKAGTRNTSEAALKLYSRSDIENMYSRMNEMRIDNLRKFFVNQGVSLDNIIFEDIDESSTNKSKVTIKFGVDLPDNVDDIEPDDEE